MALKLKDVKRAHLRKGFRFRYPKWRNVWEVKEIVKRGAIVEVAGDGGHYHLLEWEEEIEPV